MMKKRIQFLLILLPKTLILKMIKILLTLDDWMYKKKEKILLRLTSLRAYKRKLLKKISEKKVTRGLFDDYGIVPNEQKN